MSWSPSLRLAAPAVLPLMIGLVAPGPLGAEPPVPDLTDRIPDYLELAQEHDDLGFMIWISESALRDPSLLPDTWRSSVPHALEELRFLVQNHEGCLPPPDNSGYIIPPFQPGPTEPRPLVERLIDDPIVVTGELIARTPGISSMTSRHPTDLVTVRITEVIHDRRETLVPGDLLHILRHGGQIEVGTIQLCAEKFGAPALPPLGTEVFLNGRWTEYGAFEASRVLPLEDGLVVIEDASPLTLQQLRTEAEKH